MAAAGPPTRGWTGVLPDWVQSLQVLAPVASTLATVATDPEEWLRGFVFDLIAEWIVSAVLGVAEYAIGWVIFAFERFASIVLTAVPVLESPFRIAGNTATGAIETLFAAVRGIATTAGLTGPPATAFAVVLSVSVVLAIGVAVWRLIPGSDAIEGGIEVFTK